MTEIELRYTLTVDEAVSAMRSRILRNWSVRWLFLAASLFALTTLVFNLATGDIALIIVAVVPIILVAGLFIFFYYSPYTRARLRNEPRFFIEQHWRFGEDRIDHKTKQGESHQTWATYAKASETAQFFFLFLNHNQIAPIPKRAFANAQEQARFRELLKRKIAKWE